MKRKQLIAVSIFSICLFASACGSNTTDTETIAVVETTETQQAEIETEDEVTESKIDEAVKETETTDSDTAPNTNSEGLTVDEAEKADYEYMEEEVYKYYEGDIDTKMAAVKKDYGIDSLCGAWFIYYYGSAAGDKRSYAINQRTGEKIVAGPNSYFYGTSLEDDGASPFYGTDKVYPGDEFSEFEENLTLAISGQPAHTNGQ